MTPGHALEQGARRQHALAIMLWLVLQTRVTACVLSIRESVDTHHLVRVTWLQKTAQQEVLSTTMLGTQNLGASVK